MTHQNHEYRLHELGNFLRTRRARLGPEAVGLPRGGRRKTPGLRRAEVAQLIGVSVDWYTWLEQGRSIRPSTQVLERLVQILRLDAHERNHLFFLAQQQAPPAVADTAEVVSPALQRVLDRFGDCPAFVSGRCWDILAWNDAGCAVFGDYRQRLPDQRNTVWNVFTNPLARLFIADWEADARHLLAQFRSTWARYPDDPRLRELLGKLQEHSPEFRAWWPDHEVQSGQEGLKVLNHPQAGRLVFERLILQLFDTPDLKITVYTPREEADTPRKLAGLIQQWHQQEQATSGAFVFTTSDTVRGQPAEADSVGAWFLACCSRSERHWVANSAIMASYRGWCAAYGWEPKTPKAVAQALASFGCTISVNKRIADSHGQQRMVRGVRGILINSTN